MTANSSRPSPRAMVAAIVCLIFIILLVIALSEVYEIGESVSLAFQSVGTLALVGVTAWYVHMTSRLVQAQEQTLQQAIISDERRVEEALRHQKDQAVRELWSLYSQYGSTLSTVGEEMRVADMDLGGPPSIDDYRRFANRVAEASDALVRGITRCQPELPTELLGTAVEANLRLGTAAQHLFALVDCLDEISLQVRAEGRDFFPDDAGDRFTTAYRPRLPDKPEWREVVSGATVSNAGRSVEMLGAAAYRHLSGGNLPDEFDMV